VLKLFGVPNDLFLLAAEVQCMVNDPKNFVTQVPLKRKPNPKETNLLKEYLCSVYQFDTEGFSL
jgi:hypothetical protein